jgi:hypothetical protein
LAQTKQPPEAVRHEKAQLKQLNATKNFLDRLKPEWVKWLEACALCVALMVSWTESAHRNVLRDIDSELRILRDHSSNEAIDRAAHEIKIAIAIDSNYLRNDVYEVGNNIVVSDYESNRLVLRDLIVRADMLIRPIPKGKLVFAGRLQRDEFNSFVRIFEKKVANLIPMLDQLCGVRFDGAQREWKLLEGTKQPVEDSKKAACWDLRREFTFEVENAHLARFAILAAERDNSRFWTWVIGSIVAVLLAFAKIADGLIIYRGRRTIDH